MARMPRKGKGAAGGPYWSQWPLHYGPIHAGRARPSLHQLALSNPAPYGAAGPRRPLLGPEPIFTGVQPRPTLGVGPRPGLLALQNQPLYRDFDAPQKPTDLQVTYTTCSTEAQVNWTHPHVARSVQYSYQVTVEGGHRTQTLDFPQWRTYITLGVTPGTWYKVHVTASAADHRRLADGLVEFKSVFSQKELKQLCEKAFIYCGDEYQMEPFKVFYRNKPRAYWEDIHMNRGGIVEKYIKDRNGQPASAINDVIYGLFFGANLSNGKLPPTSPFGEVRLVIPAYRLLTPRHHLYFADFYCNYTLHYVTVVATIPNSETDVYCAKTLIPLDPTNNPFLKVVECAGPEGPWLEFWVMCGLIWVEMFYTENVPVDWGGFLPVKATGKSTPGGLPNNKYCTRCNLYPLKPEEGADGKRRRNSMLDDFADKAGKDDSDELFNSTFHLIMEMQRDFLVTGNCTDVPGDADLTETLCELIDSVVAEVGPTIPVPEHGFVGVERPRGKWVKELDESPSEDSGFGDVEKTEDGGGLKTEVKSETGDVNEPKLETENGANVDAENKVKVEVENKENEEQETKEKKNEEQETKEKKPVTLEDLDVLQKSLGKRWKDLSSTLTSLEESIVKLERKIKPLRQV